MALINLRHFVGKIAYPIGSIFITVDNRHPSELWGGEWTPLPTKTFLHGSSTAFPVNTGANVADGGSADQKNIAHTHPARSHDHAATAVSGYEACTGVCTYLINNTTVGRRGWLTQSVSASRYTFTISSSSYLAANQKTDAKSPGLASSGSTGTNANLPPYKYVYMYLRTGW